MGLYMNGSSELIFMFLEPWHMFKMGKQTYSNFNSNSQKYKQNHIHQFIHTQLYTQRHNHTGLHTEANTHIYKYTNSHTYMYMVINTSVPPIPISITDSNTPNLYRYLA